MVISADVFATAVRR